MPTDQGGTERKPSQPTASPAVPKVKIKWSEVKWETVIAGVAALSAVLAAAFTWWQITVSKDTEHRQLRAYVVVNSVSFAKGADGNFKLGRTFGDRSELLVYYDVENQGATPAYDLYRKITVEYPFANKFSFDYTDGTSAYLSKQQTIGPVRTRPFTKEEIDAISRGATDKTTFVFAGQMTYRDIWGDQWPTDFCYFYAAITPEDIKFIPCPRWNDNDRLNYAR
jgi:hypothetical protein